MFEKIIGKNNSIDLIDLGLIRINGKDVKQFLQGQLTCDLEEISAEQSRLGAHCDVKGRVIASLRLFFYQNNYYFLLPLNMLPLLLASLQKYAVFSKITLTDVSKDWQKIGLYGPYLKELLNDQKLYVAKENEVAEFNNKLGLSIPGPTPRIILLVPTSEPIGFIDALEQQNIDHWHLLDIMAGIPTIYPETSSQFTPHQLNFPQINGVSFNKGCYIGQEIIARTHYLGKSKSRLYRVSFQANNPHLPGTPLFDNNQKTEKGTLIRCAKELDNRYQALACLQIQAISHSIRLGSPEGPLIDFLELPYSIN
ncbi:MAG TPA: hypothetical protein VGH95_00705 [Candidatus Aquirickettsiella sp.]|jgi:hypothetical protein